MNLRAYSLFAAIAAPASLAGASLTLVAGPALDRTQNMVFNGSFELGAPTPDGSRYYWATGTTNSPFAVPPGWQSSGAPDTYASWGNDGPGAPRINSSDVFPDGRNGLYFGNLFANTNDQPTFHADGTVTWGSGPTLTPDYGAPAVLTQTISTNTSLATSFSMSFWASGENAADNIWTEGIFGLRVTNVLPGDPIQYLTAPGGLGFLGQSHLYRFDFTPINASLPVTIEFINWGHWKGAFSTGFATELVLDDVIINEVPAPAAVAPLLAAFCASRRRR